MTIKKVLMRKKLRHATPASAALDGLIQRFRVIAPERHAHRGVGGGGGIVKAINHQKIQWSIESTFWL
ncbi:hypothetical protein [Pseudomonas cavernicola]|uniref:hypothetical protein n=1 Tax=Pseudomonas cavernicola TaxID=2320866 RepID=UPI001EE5EEEB|nr:hypothetical protein [Pseudomonas cavernicola]